MLLGPRKVQLIDATQWFEPLRKNLGKKNRELSEEDIQRICDTFLAFEETAQSKIFPNRAFGYWKVTVERPLPLAVDLSPEQRLRFRAACREAQAAAPRAARSTHSPKCQSAVSKTSTAT